MANKSFKKELKFPLVNKKGKMKICQSSLFSYLLNYSDIFSWLYHTRAEEEVKVDNCNPLPCCWELAMKCNDDKKQAPLTILLEIAEGNAQHRIIMIIVVGQCVIEILNIDFWSQLSHQEEEDWCHATDVIQATAV